MQFPSGTPSSRLALLVEGQKSRRQVSPYARNEPRLRVQHSIRIKLTVVVIIIPMSDIIVFVVTAVTKTDVTPTICCRE